MNIVVCVEEKFGMSFGGRRLSQDRLLIDDLMKTVGNNRLFISPYSQQLFKEYSHKIIVDSDFLIKAKSDDYCFVEINDFKDIKEEIGSIILYKWNRRYPADLFFDSSYIEGREPLTVSELEGNSHKLITKEVYKL